MENWKLCLSVERKNFLVEPTEGDDPPLLPEEAAGPTLRSAFPEKKVIDLIYRPYHHISYDSEL